jgi:hypothetical protein
LAILQTLLDALLLVDVALDKFGGRGGLCVGSAGCNGDEARSV